MSLTGWLQERADRRPAANSIPMLDGYVAAIVAGPVSINRLDWICWKAEFCNVARIRGQHR